MNEQAEKKHDIALTDVMLAMDVVDTLRHRETLVQRELNADAREQALIEKVRSIYASQGIEVSEATIAEGVKALQEERFVYAPPPPGLRTRLAHWYIDRGKWGKRLGIVALVGGLAWGGYWATQTLPKQRALQQQALSLNSSIEQADVQSGNLSASIENLEKQFSVLQSNADDSRTRGRFASIKEDAESLLNRAKTQLESAAGLAQRPNFDRDDYRQRGSSAEGRVVRQRQFLTQAQNLVGEAEQRIRQLEQLNQLPAELAGLRDKALGLALSEQAKSAARRHYQEGMASLNGLDFAAANGASTDLKDLAETLQQAYEIRIVSRAGERSGVFRIPDINQGARNYYIVVEAIAADGNALTLPILNEENGKLHNVNKWAMRVEKNIFDRVARDKQDDGIIQGNRFGLKRRGYLAPEYSMPTNGKAITNW